jgi:hypothetical protein
MRVLADDAMTFFPHGCGIKESATVLAFYAPPHRLDRRLLQTSSGTRQQSRLVKGILGASIKAGGPFMAGSVRE